MYQLNLYICRNHSYPYITENIVDPIEQSLSCINFNVCLTFWYKPRYLSEPSAFWANMIFAYSIGVMFYYPNIMCCITALGNMYGVIMLQRPSYPCYHAIIIPSRICYEKYIFMYKHTSMHVIHSFLVNIHKCILPYHGETADEWYKILQCRSVWLDI